MIYLYFDTETSGLPVRGADWRKSYNNFPEVVSISWKLTGHMPSTYIINHPTLVIPTVATAIHGITTKQVRTSEHAYTRVINLLAKDAAIADRVVGFNTYFDVSMVKANLAKRSEKFLLDMLEHSMAYPRRVDVMRATQHLFDNGKWPKLTELHKLLFGKGLEDAHDAEVDMLALERCHLELLKRKIL